MRLGRLRGWIGCASRSAGKIGFPLIASFAIAAGAALLQFNSANAEKAGIELPETLDAQLRSQLPLVQLQALDRRLTRANSRWACGRPLLSAKPLRAEAVVERLDIRIHLRTLPTTGPRGKVGVWSLMSADPELGP